MVGGCRYSSPCYWGNGGHAGSHVLGPFLFAAKARVPVLDSGGTVTPLILHVRPLMPHKMPGGKGGGHTFAIFLFLFFFI